MKRFKEEYQNCTVTVNSPSLGRQQVNTATADPNKWANVPEFEYMTEDCTPTEFKAPKQEVKKEEPKTNLEDLSLNELREIYPDIKATSKKAFLEQIM